MEVLGPSARFRRNVAVVIGIDTYGVGVAPLRSAVADAKAIATALGTDHGFETVLRCEEDAALPRLRELLHNELPGSLTRDDRLVFYFAGHGIAQDSDGGPAGYLLPHGAGRAPREGFLAMSTVHDALARLPVRHALLVFDCCFAGTFRWSTTRDLKPEPVTIYRERYDRYIASPAWQVLTSTSADQLALDVLAGDRGESGENHSPFAAALLEGLAGAADYTNDGVITADELGIYVRERVAPAGEERRHRQVPQLFPLRRHDAGQFVFQVPGRTLALAKAPALDERSNPYRGLQSFGEQDRALFFGRARVTQELVEAIDARPLTVVVGPSGSGKSSVLFAGALPVLRERGWKVVVIPRPHTASQDWRSAIGDRAVVVVDQLEELLTHRVEQAARTEFLEALASAIERGARVVVTIRSDTEPQLHGSPLDPWWVRFPIPAMSRDELREAIEKPASAAVLHFEPTSLVDRLLDDVALVPAPLPLLSFALSELYRACWARWQTGATDRALREDDYRAMGSVAGALGQRATALHDALVAEDPAYAITIRNVFTRMVATTTRDLARRRVPRDELVFEDEHETRRVDEVLERFHRARLIALASDGGVGYAEPIHDELVRGWAHVTRWLEEIDEPPGTRALLAVLADSVRSWRTHGRRDGYLWSDPRAEVVEALVRDRPLAFNADEATFARRSGRIRRGRRTRLVDGLLASRRLLARSYAETGRRLLLDGFPARALPYLLEARKAGALSTPLRLLFGAAARGLPAFAMEHERPVLRAVFSGDGTRIATLAVNGAARVWDATTGAPLCRWLTLRSASSFALDGDVAVDRSGKRLVTTREVATLWHIEADASSELAHPHHVRGARFDPSGGRIVTFGDDGTARLWDNATPLAVLEHASPVVDATFSDDGTRLATATADAVRIWDAASFACLHVLPAREERLAFSPDGSRLVGDAMAWDAVTGAVLPLPAALSNKIWWKTVISPDATMVATITTGQELQIWDTADGEPLTPAVAVDNAPPHVVFSRDGALLAIASTAGSVRIWDPRTAKSVSGFLEHRFLLNGMTFDASGKRLLTACSDYVARVWHVAPPSPAHVIALAGRVDALDLVGDRVAIASEGNAQVWNVTTGDAVSPLIAHPGARAIAYDPTHDRVVLAGDEARVFDAQTGAPVAEPFAHGVHAVAFSSDGSRVATAGDDGKAQIWRANDAVALVTFMHDGPATGVAFSAGDAELVTASRVEKHQRFLRVWDSLSGRALTEPLEGFNDLAGRAHARLVTRDRIITGSVDDQALLVDITTGQPVTPPLVHLDLVTGGAFSPDGTRVVTTSADKTARVWDAATGRPVTRFLAHADAVFGAVFSGDGSVLLTSAFSSAAQLWDATTGEPLSAILHHQDLRNAARLTPDARWVVTIENRNVLIWDTQLDRGTLADWIASAARGMYELARGVLSPREWLSSDERAKRQDGVAKP